jgi:hypothetical protein
MSEYFAAAPLGNSSVLCVGGITRSEAEAARGDGVAAGGEGYFLFLADETAPRQPIRVLARFFSPLEAEQLCRLLSGRPA